MKIRGHKIHFTKPVVVGAVVNALMCLTFAMANKMTTAANAIVLQFTMPVFIIILLWIFWKQKPGSPEMITVAVSIFGMVFFFIESIDAGGIVGNIIAIVSGFLYALVFLLKKIPGVDFESAVLFSHVINFVIGLPFLVKESDFSLMNLLTVFALGTFQLGVAYICLNIGLDKVQPVAAALISMIEPILNPILVAIFYGEKMGIYAIIGAVIVLGSATYYNLRQIR